MTLIIGYGNPLRGDDGVGPAVAEALRGRLADTDIVTTQTLVPELAERVAHHSRVVFIDARVGDTPGRVTATPVTAGAIDPSLQGHGLSTSGIVALAAQLYDWRGDAWLVSIEAATFDYDVTLSSAVAAAVGTAAAQVAELLSTAVPDR